MIELRFPDNSVEADTDSRYDVGGHQYKDLGSNLSHVAYDAIMFGAGELTPHGWVLDAGEIMTDMLTSIVEKYDRYDSIKRAWHHYRPRNLRNPGHLVPQGSGWASYIAEYEQGGWAPASLTIDLKHGFAINHPIFATDVWAYCDETSFTLWNKYC